MKKRFLPIAAFMALLLAINAIAVYAEEITDDYVEYEDYEFEDVELAPEIEPDWNPIRANVGSPLEFFFRVSGNVTINEVNERSWFWIVDPWHLRGLELEGFDVSFFQSLDSVMASIPHIEYLLDTWNWDVRTFLYLDMPTMHLTATANARIEFDFFAESLMVLSWAWEDEALRDVEMAGGFISPGASVTLPGAPSFTAIYFHAAYGPGMPVQAGHVLLLVEVPCEDGRRIPAFSFNPADHIPSDFAATSVERAIALDILPEQLHFSFRRPINRLDFAALAVYLHERSFQREIAGRAHFNDTTDENAQKMGFLGIMTENEFGNFAPSNPVTREQAALLMVRLASVMGVHLPHADGSFADSEQISWWAQDAALQVFGSGIMGVEDGHFDPNRIPTREEVIVMMVRLFEMPRG